MECMCRSLTHELYVKSTILTDDMYAVLKLVSTSLHKVHLGCASLYGVYIIGWADKYRNAGVIMTL